MLAAAVLLTCCGAPPDEADPGAAASSQAEGIPAPYAFGQPAAVHKLPPRLREISGVAVVDEDLVAAIQDEEGTIFLLDLHSGRVVEERPFGKAGDYEDLALVEDRMVVLRSDGRLFAVPNWRTEAPEVETYETGLERRHDTEGLAYDARNKRLLIACKEDPGEGLQGHRAVYAFDLQRAEHVQEPAFTLSLDALAPFLQRTRPASLPERAWALLQGGQDEQGFKPSAIALHPVTGDLWVLSSVTRAVALLRPDGTLHALFPLPARLFPQPEGLAFLPGGDLLISNEGRAGPATLLRFNYRNVHG